MFGWRRNVLVTTGIPTGCMVVDRSASVRDATEVEVEHQFVGLVFDD